MAITSGGKGSVLRRKPIDDVDDEKTGNKLFKSLGL